jgi:transposase
VPLSFGSLDWQQALESARKKTAPRKVDWYEVFCAVLYLPKSGCSWRMLPESFPKWRTAHSYFTIWSEPVEGGSQLERALKKSGGATREKQEREAHSTFLIVDAQSVKNTDMAGQKGCDAGKKVSGIKRHIAVDTQGLPHVIAMTTADVTDRQGALKALDHNKASLNLFGYIPRRLRRINNIYCYYDTLPLGAGLFIRVESFLGDNGYTGEPFAQGGRDILGERVTVQIAKRSALHPFKLMPKRWVVERSFAWLEKNRRLWKNCERLFNTSLQFIHLAFLALLLRIRLQIILTIT